MPLPSATTRSTMSWRKALLMPAVYMLFTMVVFWRLWTPIEDVRGTWKYDPQHAYWGDLELQTKSMADGGIALWDPYDRGGYPVYGDPQPGILYPPNWPLVAIGALQGSIDYRLVESKIIFHWIFAAIGMHLFLRRRRCSEPACYLAGLLVCVMCPALRVSGSALNWAWAWFPWVLISVDAFASHPGYRRAVVVGSAVAMVLLAGAPAVAWYLLLFAAPFVFYRLWGRLRTNARYLGVAVVVGCAWVAPLILSMLEMLPHTTRATIDYEFVAGRGLTPTQLLNVLVPPLHGGEPIFVGLLPLMAWALLATRSAKRASGERRLALVFAGTALLGVILAMGGSTGIMPAAASALPPMRLFRFAYRYIYITNAAVAIGAGLGLSYLIGCRDRSSSRGLAKLVVWLGSAVTLVLAIAWMTLLVTHDKPGFRADALALGCLSSLAGTWLLRAILLASPAAKLRWAYVAVAVTVGFVWAANWRYQKVGFGPRPTLERDGIVAELEGVSEHRYRVFDADYMTYRPGTRLAIRDFRGYEEDPLALERYVSFLRAARRAPRLLGHANVRYYLEAGQDKLKVSTRGMRRMKQGVYELPNVSPAAFYVPRPVSVADQREAHARLRTIVPGEGGTVEGAIRYQGPAESGSVSGAFVRYEPNRVDVEIETPGPGLVIVNETFFPAWRTTLDGAEVETVVANGMFRGVWVGSGGRHRIEMRFRPGRFWWPMPFFLAAFAALIWSFAGLYRLRRAGMA